MISFSAPGKIHLLGEHAVVYGKPVLLTTVGLRTTVTISKGQNDHPLKKIIEQIVKKKLKLHTMPPYELTVTSAIPVGAGLGSSAAVSAAYIAALLAFLKVKRDLDLINNLTYEAEKVFHGNPSGADNTTVIFGGIRIPRKLAKNFVLINTGTPVESTKEMVEMVARNKDKFKKIFDDQEKLVKELLPVLKTGNGQEFIRIIREGEKNLESIGVVPPYVKSVIRQIEKAGGAAKICGGGGKTKATGILLCYHPAPSVVNNIAKSFNLDYFKTTLGVEGLKQENNH